MKICFFFSKGDFEIMFEHKNENSRVFTVLELACTVLYHTAIMSGQGNEVRYFSKKLFWGK